MKFIFALILIFCSHPLFAAESSFGLFEISNSLNRQNETSKILGVSLDDSRTFYFGVAFGIKDEDNRLYLGFGFERMGSITVDNQDSYFLNQFQISFGYDRILGPWLTDFFFNTSLTFIPAQGKPFTLHGVEYAPEPGFGGEIGLGWISPLGIAFNFGYRIEFRNFSYDKASSITGLNERENADLTYKGVFLTLSIGRH